jgi:putative hydrolase of the HAD superfamily
MIKLVVFDLWRTLIPATVDFVHLLSLIKKEGISKEDFIERYEKATQLKNYKNFEKLRKDFFKAFREESNDDLEKELYEIYINRFDKIKYYPEVPVALTKIKSLGFKIALLSNTESIRMKEMEEKLSLKKYFDYLSYSFETRLLKPEPKAFLHVLKKMKVLPEEALMVGDSLRTDIAGAKAVGMHTCLINRIGKVLDSADVTPDFEVKSINEVVNVLEGLNG